MPFESRIDVHAHFIPPFYRTACENAGEGTPDGMPRIPVRCPGAYIYVYFNTLRSGELTARSPGAKNPIWS
jgi:hypothetical protein